MLNFVEPSNQDTTFDPIEFDPISHTYKINVIDKLPLTHYITRITHVYKSVVRDLLMSSQIKGHRIST